MSNIILLNGSQRGHWYLFAFRFKKNTFLYLLKTGMRACTTLVKLHKFQDHFLCLLITADHQGNTWVTTDLGIKPGPIDIPF